MKAIMLIITLMVSLYSKDYYGPNDLPGQTSHDNYTLKPTFREDRHRCDDTQLKSIIGKRYKAGGWDTEYTIMYDPKSVTVKGDVVYVKAMMITTLINDSGAGEGEGYIVVDVAFNRHLKKYTITDATERTCSSEVVSKYRGLVLWEDVRMKCMDMFYKNVIIKL